MSDISKYYLGDTTLLGKSISTQAFHMWNHPSPLPPPSCPPSPPPPPPPVQRWWTNRWIDISVYIWIYISTSFMHTDHTSCQIEHKLYYFMVLDHSWCQMYQNMYFFYAHWPQLISNRGNTVLFSWFSTTTCQICQKMFFFYTHWPLLMSNQAESVLSNAFGPCQYIKI